MTVWSYVLLLVEVKLTKKKKIVGEEVGEGGGQNWARNQVFCYFVKFASLVFLDFAQDIGEKVVAQIRAKQTHIGAKIGFSSIFFLTFVKEERSY